MTAARKLLVPQTIPSPLLGKYRRGLPRTTRAPYAAYLWGSSFGTLETEDISGNGRHLTRVGSAWTDEGTSIRHASTGTYFTCPFTPDDFAGSGPANEFTVLFFGKVAGPGLLTWFQSNGLSGTTRRTDLLTGTTYDVLGVVADGTSNPSIINAGGKSAWRDDNAACFGLSGSIYNRFAFSVYGGSNWTYPAPPAPPSGDVSGRAVGGNPTTTRMLQRADGTSANVYLSGAMIYDYVLDQDQVEIAYNGMRGIFATYGLAI